ncbi:sialate O-acetylesterase [Pedobacter sp. AK013]|uniref:sialate O-acetylesterase n=1 Tax=Pedobacter sp. AK013 TaxID=2723071 RepID=UPI0017F95220|nr:sialate O-acetylesterase [Pedobacter sp. AK013]MBB6239629.1 sialate O-acetylesterase [Pedobacter sp. AK013]
MKKIMRTGIIRFFTFFVLLFSVQVLSYAQVTLPKVFGDNMVLQRGIKIPIWGKSAPGANINATLGEIRVKATANGQGEWKVFFPAFKAGGPYKLSIYESRKPGSGIELQGILIGDVWLASGQSNMEWSVQQAQDAVHEIAKADFPKIRLFQVAHVKKLSPQQDVADGKWKICSPENVAQFSAVAYYFAKKIHLDQGVPIGVIQSTWGGTPIESWTSREKLLSSPITKAKAMANDTLTEQHFVKDSLDQARSWDILYHPYQNADKIIPQPAYNDAGWPVIEMPKLIKDFGIGPYEGMIWMRKKIILPETFSKADLTLYIGRPDVNYSLYFNGTEICKAVWNTNLGQHYTIPAKILKKGENTVTLRLAMLWGIGGLNPPADEMYITNGKARIALAGTWKYQKDLEPAMAKNRNYQYYPSLLFNSMINPLVSYGIKGFLWYQGEANDTAAYNYRKLFPILIKDWRERWKQGNLPFLYVQLPNFKQTQPLPSESEWAELREAQALALLQPNTAMACTIDIGEADNIHPGNKKEVARRLALAANKLVYKQDIVTSGPSLKSFSKEGSRMRIHFTAPGNGLISKDAKALTGFAIAGEDRQFHWAEAKIEGNEVVVYSEKVPHPVAVRYDWADYPLGNLVSSEGLPALPFRTDDWKGITQK